MEKVWRRERRFEGTRKNLEDREKVWTIWKRFEEREKVGRNEKRFGG